MRNNLGTIGSYRWFIAQVATGQNQFVKGGTFDDNHAERVKIRIPGKHPRSSSEVSDDNLPWAIVAKPTTTGNRNHITSGIWGGEWVIGFFMDEGEQQPVITHVLDNNLPEFETNVSNSFKRVNRFNSGMKPSTTQIVSGSSPDKPAEPDAYNFEKLDSKVGILDKMTLLRERNNPDLKPPEKENLEKEAEEVRNRIKKSENNPTK